ncbi:MAG: DNA adenine methylase [Candidatus Lokiarchaeota archaeon]|nr:DNA adenine methylase [Candidatus Lokiarchaeota archaeon]
MQNIDKKKIRLENRKYKKITGVPHPFLKWAGGKRQLMSQIDPFIPENFDNYIEPFVGGGALFFYLLPDKAILIDNNPVLVNAYQVIKNNVDELIELLKQHVNDEKYYYKIRNIDREEEFQEWTLIERASRIIYLNRCCYNGLFRVNSKGFFNVPFGRYKNPNFCNEKNLRIIHQILQNVKLIHGSFELCIDFAKKNDFVYFDPPYSPLSKTANFTSYTKENFDEKDQLKLKFVIDKLSKRRVKVLLSNSNNDFILKLYENYHIEIVKAKRAINSNPCKRGNIKEVLITNY